MHCRQKSLNHSAPGITAMELVVYVGLLAVISVFLVQSLTMLMVAYRRLQGERDVVSSARTAMETLARETQGAASIYTPTSVLGVTTGQLSLETPLNPTAGETRSYVDFYVDNERLHMKREGSAAIALTSESARVTQFNVQRILAGARETAEITLEIKSRSRGTLETSSLVKASFTPRGSY
ncbi:MAG: hypothetical protein UY64_C0014G0036 [Parcubacteria group bacterium GW2011_GWA1_51_12]|nr:MAG: hypothetical protein UY64_C0014G0036 [Parcubacteria group bacterium GW2011_GWA1_51_12]